MAKSGQEAGRVGARATLKPGDKRGEVTLLYLLREGRKCRTDAEGRHVTFQAPVWRCRCGLCGAEFDLRTPKFGRQLNCNACSSKRHADNLRALHAKARLNPPLPPQPKVLHFPPVLPADLVRPSPSLHADIVSAALRAER